MKENYIDYYINEFTYNQLTIANDIAFEIMKEFINKMYEISDSEIYTKGPKSLIQSLKELTILSQINHQEVKFALSLSKDEIIEKSNGEKIIHKYYFKDAAQVIYSCIYYQNFILEIKSKKFCKYLTDAGKKERDKIRIKTKDKLKKLQEDLFSLTDNDTSELEVVT